MFANVPKANANHVSQSRFSVGVGYKRAPILEGEISWGHQSNCLLHVLFIYKQILNNIRILVVRESVGERASTLKFFP